MIDAIATRSTTLNGITYDKGAIVPMPLQQFEDLEPTGLFERAPAKKAAKPAPTKKVSKPAEAKDARKPASGENVVQPVPAAAGAPSDAP